MSPRAFSRTLSLAAVAALALTACGSQADTTDAVTMEHIHGIGVDPGDGTVYAGTHYGLFRIAEDGPERVADRVQDFMGFAVAGPGHFLASGHPGEGQGGPAAVGLIESTDAGETWQEKSLAGEADFHALEYRHERAYGFNSMTGQLLVSDDLTTWTELSRVAIADFAVSPGDPDVLIVTTQEGLALTDDAGGSFEPVPDAPPLLLVSWADDGTLAGVSPDGAVHTADSPSGPWAEQGSIGGRPEALTVVGAGELYAATGGRVLMSDDGGATFAPVGADGS